MNGSGLILARKLRSLAHGMLATADALQRHETAECVGTARYLRGSGVATCGRRSHQLTRSEAKILEALLDSRGVIVSRDDLTALLFGSNSVTSRTIDMHVANIRAKIGSDIIETVFGRGYRIREVSR